MIRVAIVDDERLLRSGLQLMIDAAADLEVVASCSGVDALRQIAETRPHLVLLDIRMPEIDGLTILRELRGWEDPPVVAMLTTFQTDELIAEALRSGARGYLLKDVDPPDLTAAVRSLVSGQSTLAPAVARTVIDGYLRRADETEAVRMVDRLSPREREILRLIAEGLSNAEIGNRLYLSSSTVKDHVSAVLNKLDVNNRVQAAVLAHRARLVEDS
ncbi:response regulator [Microlunatus sp. GCM10028923]|uniref:response regulator n=1 Tax=Microlunatus sp. GCM10028923 TaxID=3273400 RepID=UPI00360CFA15